MVQLSFYLAAAVVSATQYYGNNGKRSGDNGGDAGYANDDGTHRGLFAGGGDEEYQFTLTGLCSGIISIVGTIAEQSGIRCPECSAKHSRLQCVIQGIILRRWWLSHHRCTPLVVSRRYLYFQIHLIVMVLFCFPSGGRHKEVTVPMNIDCESFVSQLRAFSCELPYYLLESNNFIPFSPTNSYSLHS